MKDKIPPALICITFALLGFFSLHTQASSSEADLKSIVASSAEQEVIFTTVLNEKINSWGRPFAPPEPGKPAPRHAPRPVLMITTTAKLCDSTTENAPEGCEEPTLTDGITSDYVDRHIPMKLRLELLAANKQSSQLTITPSKKIQLVSQDEINKIMQEPDGWKSFYIRYPNTAGFVEISRAVLSADRTHALVYIAHYCDGLCGTGYLHYLVRSHNRWKIEISSLIWIS